MKGGCGRREGTDEPGKVVMWDEGVESNWRAAAEGVMLEIREWRKQHPKATLTETLRAAIRTLRGVLEDSDIVNRAERLHL